MKKFSSIILIILVFTGWACDIRNNDIEPTNTFAKIYDDNRFEQEYYPLDVIQTADDGFLILAEVKFDQALFTAVYIIKTDAQGEVVTQTQMADPYANAVNGWGTIGDTYYFVCLDTNTLDSRLVPVDEAGTVGDPIAVGGLTYPLTVAQDNDELIILAFDNTNNETVIATVTTDGQITRQAGYSIGAGVDVEKPIIDHLTRNGPKLPFTVGKTTAGTYFFNGFYNYSFSLVFTNFGNSPTGVCQGQLSQGGISAVTSLGNESFGVARFNFGDNYLNPITSIPTNSITSSTDLGGNTFPEIESGAKVKLTLWNDSFLLYGSHTQSRQIVLYGFDKNEGKISGTTYLGSGNPYAFASYTFTRDGGIAILAETAIEGRFPRIALFKRDALYVVGLLH